MEFEELLGLTLDWNLDCSPEESGMTEISAWIWFFFFQFRVLSFPYLSFVPFIVCVYVCLFSQPKFYLFQNEGVLCENKGRKKVCPGSTVFECF